ncbi:MAG: hypothetical protein HFI42_07710 [Lachnospiraceae bacterium]|nr:hypothetical protein [Lachnospiraceae bacterium]MCI9150376.1 hypothetical protein [Lachnospiraceae bacterium]
MFGIRMKRILGSRVFWGTVVLYAAIMVAGAWEDLLAARDNPSVSLPYLYVVTTTVGIAHVLIPIVTLIPFAFFYVEELEKKSIYYNLIRCSKRSYYLSNAFAAILSCVLVFAGALCLYLLAGVACGAGFYHGAGLLSCYEGSCFEPWFYTEQLWRLLAVNILLFLTASVPWGLLCLAVSILSKNKYIVIAFPFILEQLFSYGVYRSPVPVHGCGVALYGLLASGKLEDVQAQQLVFRPGLSGGSSGFAGCCDGGLLAVGLAGI